MSAPLRGRTVITTRDRPGRLDAALESRGVHVVHIPLIEIADVDHEVAAALSTEIGRLRPGDWLVVTSQHGAERVARVGGAPTGVRTAAVGSRTAEALETATGRRVDLVPDRQTGADLVAAMPRPDASGVRALVAQADRANPDVGAGLGRLGYDVVTVTAYRTIARQPSDVERAAARDADALALASGSAARSWVAAFGRWSPPLVVAIGPTTASVATASGLAVTHVASDHTLEGLVTAVERALSGTRSQ